MFRVSFVQRCACVQLQSMRNAFNQQIEFSQITQWMEIVHHKQTITLQQPAQVKAKPKNTKKHTNNDSTLLVAATVHLINGFSWCANKIGKQVSAAIERFVREQKHISPAIICYAYTNNNAYLSENTNKQLEAHEYSYSYSCSHA